MFKHMKRSTAVILILAILAMTTVVAYAVTTLFFKGETQTSDYSKKTYFEFEGRDSSLHPAKLAPVRA